MGSERSECIGCSLVFNGVKAFEAHRIGEGTNRRCLTDTEMTTRGFTRGRWKRWDSPDDAISDPPMRPRKAGILKGGK